MTYLIDTHAHLHMMQEEIRADVIRRAQEAGVKKIVNVACNVREIGQCLPLTDEYDFIWTTAGIHPTELGEDIEKDLEQVLTIAKNEERVVAIGEIGIDYYHDKFPREKQIAYLVGQLNVARLLDLPAVLHCRSGRGTGENSTAFKDLIEVLKNQKFSRAVSHCFSGNKSEAKALLELGCFLSFTGIITYDQNNELREIVKETPLDRIMVETDSPFLTPKAHRGKKNEPAYVVEVAQTIADVKGIAIEEVMETTSNNAEAFFGI